MTTEPTQSSVTITAQRVTEKDVHDACKTILLTGTYPSVEKIQLHLGRNTGSKKGSSTTVHKYQRTWLDMLKQSQDILLPSPIPQTALDAIVEMWSTIKNQVALEYTELEKQLSDDLDQARTQHQIAQSKNKSLQTMLEGMESSYQSIKSQLATTAEQNTKLISEISTLNTTIDNLESRYSQLQDNHEAEKTRLTARYERAIMQLDTELEAANTAKQEASEQIKHERERSTQEINRWMREVDTARQEIKTVTENSKATQSRLSAEVNLAHKQAQSAQIQLSNLKDTYHELRSQNSDINNQLQQQKAENERLLQTINQKSQKDFHEGIFYSSCIIASIHDEPAIAADILMHAGLTQSDVSYLDPTEKEQLKVLAQKDTRIRLTGL